jgi:hypothetical protein
MITFLPVILTNFIFNNSISEPFLPITIPALAINIKTTTYKGEVLSILTLEIPT